MNNRDLKELRDCAVDAAIEAGRHVRNYTGRLSSNEIEHKGTHDLVTRLDKESQDLIIDRLSKAFPSSDFLAEENGVGNWGEVEEGTLRWIIDPIDGTTNFAQGLPHYSVSIGLQDGKDLIVGVVYDVSTDELFSAVKDGGLYLNGRRTHATKRKTLSESVLATGFPFKEYQHIDAFLAAFKTMIKECRSVRRLGSAAIDLAYVAAGRLDGFFEVGLSPWDVAAGTVLVREGGGVVSDMSGSDQFLFKKHIIASNGLIHDDVKSHMQDLLESYTAIE